ncbi:AlwI family type II restriction endonuclease [Senegalia massiliensis]|uniref:AlwI family type II restriction endonuclease n=1 Tax=Senegalia massiliensis TaxID=1720316 RepID=UPI001032539B|nr:AlwI family type II restriction endonuclease [Senegalia massiliensis]
MNSWWFRMKPRSILRTIEWFPYFAALEGKNWNLKDEYKKSKNTKQPINIIRREYIYNAHKEGLKLSYDEFMSGEYDEVDVESAARNDKISFEFFGFGYVDNKNIVKVTDIGKLIVNKKMNDEFLLKQLLKLQFPSPIVKKKYKGNHVFAMEILIEVFKHFKYLTQLEIGLLFGCMDIKEVDITIEAIKKFRNKYNNLTNKLKTKDVMKIYKDILKNTYPKIKNKPMTYIDYADAFIRALTYTGLFLTRGRGIYTKLYIPEHSKVKIKLLQEKYKFIYNNERNLDLYMKYFGSPYNIILPWDNKEDRKIIVNNKMKNYKNIIKQEKQINKEFFIKNLPEIEKLIQSKEYKKLVIADEKLSESLLNINEQIFIQSLSKRRSSRKEIINKFEDINKGNEDMAALWLEVNTWKSLVAINGKHKVKRNFKIEEDLTPKSFAPGGGNTPDMEVYFNGFIIIPEVSLMSGVRQWEHEGSSVIDHVLKFIEEYKEKDVYGIFISKKMNVRLIWQFFILNKESWIGRNVPVIPITIEQYVDVISHIYIYELDINIFIELISKINKNALNVSNYMEWEVNINNIIKEWKNENTTNNKILKHQHK